MLSWIPYLIGLVVVLMLVFYDPRQNAAKNESYSPSAGKPAWVIAAWRAAEIPLSIETPTPLTHDEIALAHDLSYVEGVLNCSRPNGFHNKLPEVAASLPWTTGSFASAAVHAARTGLSAASPTSGFHHAGYGKAADFCTFNGLVIAAQMVRKMFPNEEVGILDCDQHYGNGTDEIIKRLKLSYIRHWTFGGEGITTRAAIKWLTDFPEIIETFKGCRVLLYQAGADPHVNDPLGGVLTTAQLKFRDRIVFQTCKQLKIPLAWNLAGGYQEPLEKVLEIHTNTALEFEESGL